LIFEKLVLKNWISYWGVNHIELSTNKNKKITLIRGVNKGGKTSILRALKWVLYEDTGDIKQFKKPFELLNREAKRNGDFKLQVSLNIKKDKKTIEITRSLQPRRGINKPNNKDFGQSHLSIKEDGKNISEDLDKYIRTLLPKEIHNFFLFDGEKLQDYNDLVLQTEKAIDLKDQIEKVIQTPYLISASSDLQVLNTKIGKDLSKQITDKKMKNLYQRERDLTDLLTQNQNDKDFLEKEIKEQHENLKKIKSDLNEFGDSVQDIADLSVAEKRNNELNQNLIPATKEDIKELTANAWRATASLLIGAKHKELNERLTSINKEQENYNLNTGLEKSLQKSIDDNICFLCDEELTIEKKKSFEKKIKKIKNSGAPDRSQEKENILGLISLKSSDDNFDELIKKSTKLNTYEDESVENQVKIENLNKKLKNIKNKDVAKLQKDKDDLLSEIGILEGKLKKVSNRIKGPDAYDPNNIYGPEGIEAALKNTNELLAQYEADQPKTTEKQKIKELSVKIKNLLDRSVEELINNIKVDIEKYANEINKVMSGHSESSRKLKINDNYGLKVLDKNAEEIATSSMGNQIIALSLLHGLKKATNKQGPLVVDTPLARADEEHSISVLEAYSQMSDQVILLVTGKEVPKGSDYEDAISDQVGKWYEISRVDDEISEIIEP